MNALRVLAGWILARLLGRRRGEDARPPRPTDPRAIAEREQDPERVHDARRAELLERLERARTPYEEEAARRDAAHALAADHEQIRRRRAEPPPTLEREEVSSPLAEWLVVAGLLGMALGAAGFVVFFVVLPDTQLLGLCLGVAFLLGGSAVALAGKRVVPQEKVAEPYHHFGDPEAQQDVKAVTSEARDGISRRKLIAGAAGLAGGTVGAAALVPATSLGPSVGQRIYTTPWKAGVRVVDSQDRLLYARDVDEGTFVLAFPEHASHEDLGSPIMLLRFAPADLALPDGRERFAPEGIVAYSRICTHAGCAVSMYRRPLHPPNEPSDALVCPCHYSTFDAKRGGEVLFGPAGRPLPQLPLRLGPGGVLEAAGDFTDPIGPSYGGIRLEDDPR